MNTDHYISILAVKDSLIENLHETIGRLKLNLKERVVYELELKKTVVELERRNAHHEKQLQVFIDYDTKLLEEEAEGVLKYPKE